MISGLSPRWGRRWFASVAFLVFCQAFRVLGARLDASLPPVPPPDHIEVGVLREAAWAAIACGADYLRTLAATNYQGLVVEPSVKRWVRKAYTRRYREETYDHPIYEEKWEYEEVLVPKQGSMGEHRELVKIRRPIPGSVKRVLVGTEKRTRLVDDPNGPIVREYPEEIHPEVWQRTFLGQNAMALYAMRRAGIPEEDPVVSRLADFLNDALNRFALPDLTWDVAWLTAAFSHLRGERFRQNRDALVRKLLGGQIVDGPSRGLWGSVCIDLPLLSAMVPYEQELAKELKKREAMLAEKPDSKTLQKRVKEADGALADFIRLYREVTQHGLRFEDCMTHWRVPESISADPLVICGLPYHALREAVADLENTALALYALRVAAEQGCLPESLERPKTPVGAPILPPEKVSAILARTMSALAGLQNRDGNFAEGNIHQPITRMEPLGLGQLKKDEVLKLPSPVTDLATVQGAAAVFDIGYLVG
ncbi:MAG: hypothetical protein N2255_01105, partial [Kiritimatiellae bacterium]|nr:hypothetical protein [Kiritimatiellia bacterium]